ncbi:hypothetical protein KEJ51_02630 [Candidatus Bathyarchaeota archaeon]|nr:hypothetical protein [Candidatus Bathyarchaeota archaeon]
MLSISLNRRSLVKVKGALKSILLGATVYDMVQDTLRMKWYMEQALILTSVGDMLGLPVSSYYRLKLIPYWINKFKSWKMNILKERDIIDKMIL